MLEIIRNKSNLRWADLSRADLSVANLSGADLSGADLRGANLYMADLRGTILSPLKSGETVNIRGILYTLFDKRGWVLSFYGNNIFDAGCHTFTFDEALSHWGGDKYPDKDLGMLYIQNVKKLLENKPRQ